MVLYISYKTCKTGLIAYASARQLDQYGRPIAGYINFCPRGTASYMSEHASTGLSTTMHEITHALVFSSTLYQYYRNWDTGKLRGLSNVVKDYTVKTDSLNMRATGKVKRIITPGVVAATRAHYGCSSLTGAALENNGGSGTAGSHWEKRALMTEYMTSGGSSEITGAFVSPISLALFQDSGWYRVSMKSADLNLWGYKAGCSFANAQCPKSDNLQVGTFCKTKYEIGVSVDRSAPAFCYMGQRCVACYLFLKLFLIFTLEHIPSNMGKCGYMRQTKVTKSGGGGAHAGGGNGGEISCAKEWWSSGSATRAHGT